MIEASERQEMVQLQINRPQTSAGQNSKTEDREKLSGNMDDKMRMRKKLPRLFCKGGDFSGHDLLAPPRPLY